MKPTKDELKIIHIRAWLEMNYEIVRHFNSVGGGESTSSSRYLNSVQAVALFEDAIEYVKSIEAE